MILRGTKISTKGLLMFGLYVCLILYVFFWDKLFVDSRVVLVGMLACSFVYILVSGKVRINTSTVMLGLILLWSMGGLLLGGDFSYGSSLALSIAASFLLFLLLQNHDKSFNAIIIFMVLCAAFYGVFVYLDMLSPELMMSINTAVLKDGSLQFYKDISSYGYYPGLTGFNCMSGFFLTLLLGFCMYKVLYPDRKRKISRGWYMTLAICAFLATIMVQKRSIFIASVVAICFMVMYSFLAQKRLNKFLIAIVLIAILYVGVSVFLENTESGVQFIARFNDSDDISSGRLGMYEKLLRNWEEYFLLGNGTGASQSMYSIGAHNIYIQIFYDHGIIGLLLYLGWFVLNLRYALIRFKKTGNASYEKCVLFMSVFVQIVFLIYGIFGNPINDLYIFLLYVFFAGIAYAKLPMVEKDAQQYTLQKTQSWGVGQ